MKNTLKIKKRRYLTRKHLLEIADLGARWDFNRKLCSQFAQRLSKETHVVYPLSFNFLHEYRRFQLCEPHMRLVISTPDGLVTVDVPVGYFEKLPMARLVKNEDETLLLFLLNESGTPLSLRYRQYKPSVRQAIRHLIRKSKCHVIKKFLRTHISAANQCSV